MKKIFLSGIVGLVFTASLIAQVNKAPNPSFEDVGKIKGVGAIESVLEWYSPEGMEPADVFSIQAKKDEVQVPLNIRFFY